MIATREGSGLIHSLIFEPYSGGGADDIAASLSSVDDILNEIRTGEGVLHALIYAPAEEENVLQDMSAALQELSAAGGSLNRILAKMEEGEGTLGLLLTDLTVFEDLKVLLLDEG